jgi:hypothetical protein
MSTQQHGFPDGDMDTESEEMTTVLRCYCYGKMYEAQEGGFDPRTCCDERERLMIEAMRAYLRPQQAPECLYERLRVTLDECCGSAIIRHTVIRRHDDA